MRFNTILKLTTALLATTSVSAYDSLKSKAGNFRIGVATDSSKFGNAGYSSAMANFNYMVAENACKMVGIQPQQGNYNFSSCDAHYNKAKELGMAFRGHCLVWHSMPPGWFEGLKGDALKNAMVEHITKVLTYYEGKIDSWDVVNEAIDDSSNGPQWKMRPSFLYQNIPDFVDLAFKTARAASSTTKLFYNDYNTEGIYGKSEAVFNFVKDMKSRGIPIDGVGLQYHVSTQSYPEYSKINDLIGRYCQLGLEVHITEMDVKSGGNAQAQAKVYSEALKACLSNSCCKAFLIWGVGDNDSWLGANEAGLIFDGNYQPKAAYNALIETLGSAGGAATAGGAPAAGGATAPAGGDNNAGGAPAAGGDTTPAGGDNNAGGAPAAGGAPVGGDNNAGGAPAPVGGDNNFGGGAPQQPPQDNNFGGGAPQQPPQDNNFGGAPGGFGGFGGNGGGFPSWGGDNNNGGNFPWGGNNNNNGGGWNPFGGNGGNGGGWNFPWGGNGGGNNFWQPSFFKKEDSANTDAPVSNAAAENIISTEDVPLNNDNCATLWAQCGGQGFNGPTCCSEGSCKVINEYFSQCVKE